MGELFYFDKTTVKEQKYNIKCIPWDPKKRDNKPVV